MPDKPVINIVATKCIPEYEVKFNKWYNEVHVPMLMKYKGLTKAFRYKIASDDDGMPKYLAFYHFASMKDFEAFSKSPEFLAAIKEMGESWPRGVEIVGKSPYELIKEW